MDNWWIALLIGAIETLVMISVWPKMRSDEHDVSITMAIVSAASLACAVFALFLMGTSASSLLVFSLALGGFLLGLALFRRSEVAMAATFISAIVILFAIIPPLALTPARETFGLIISS